MKILFSTLLFYGLTSTAFGNGNPADCFIEARKSLPQRQAKDLCGGGRNETRSSRETAACYALARELMGTDDALELCRQGGKEETVECYESATKVMGYDKARTLCKVGGDNDRFECYMSAKSKMGFADALALCAY